MVSNKKNFFNLLKNCGYKYDIYHLINQYTKTSKTGTTTFYMSHFAPKISCTCNRSVLLVLPVYAFRKLISSTIYS